MNEKQDNIGDNYFKYIDSYILAQTFRKKKKGFN